MMKITGSIVTYNNSETIEECIGSILDMTRDKGYDFKLYIYDNASTDDTVNIIKAKYPDIKVIKSDVNRGFGAGHNYIIKRVRSDYHFVINPDIVLREDVFGSMCEYMEQYPDTGLITPRILSMDGTLQPIPKYGPSIRFSFIGNLPGMKWIRRKYARLDEELTEPVKIEFCTGCFFGSRTAYLKYIKGFSNSYFLYCEDSDLSKKVLQDGKDIIYFPYVSAYHNWERENTKSLKGFFRFLKSLLIYFKKWGVQF